MFPAASDRGFRQLRLKPTSVEEVGVGDHAGGTVQTYFPMGSNARGRAHIWLVSEVARVGCAHVGTWGVLTWDPGVLTWVPKCVNVRPRCADVGIQMCARGTQVC